MICFEKMTRLLVLMLSASLIQCGMHEKRLLAHLFNQSRWDAHNPLERPASLDGKPLQVFLKCFLNQIMDMDEKNQVLSTIIWLDMKWSDYHFKWNMSEYANIRQVNLPPTKIWRPDLILYNSASEKFDQVYPTNVIVKSTGVISWIPPGLFHSICAVKVNWFPFDSQSCTLKFGTWTYQGNTVDLKLQCDNETDYDQECNHSNEVDLSIYLAHSEWALERAVVKRNVDSYGTPDQMFIDVTIYVHMQRRALYYMFNIMVPCMIMSVMSLLVFTLPPDANEKIVLGVTTLLSLTMLLQLVGDKLPQTSAGNPVLVLYFTCTIILCSWSLVFAVVLLNCHHHTGGILHVPWLIGTFVNIWLASVLWIERKPDDEEETLFPDDSTTKSKLVNQQHSGDHHCTGQANEQRKPTRSGKIWADKLDMDVEFRPRFCKRFDQSEQISLKKQLQEHALELRALMKKNLHPETSPTHMFDDQIDKSPVTYQCSPGGEREFGGEHLNKTSHKANVESRNNSETSSYTQQNTSTSSGMHIDSKNLDGLQHDILKKILILRRLRELTKEVRYVTGRMRHKDKETKTSKEWKMACRVLDRLCLTIFAALNVFTTFGILTSAPTIIKAFTSTGAPSQQM